MIQFNADEKKVNATFIGSYGNGDKDGTYDQDFAGGVVVGGPENNRITMFGNAWKAYELAEQYNVTRDTILSFKFNMIVQAQGHAICVDGDINEDTFGGSRIRCFMVGGTQVEQWDHVIKPEPEPEFNKKIGICHAESFEVALKDIFLGENFVIKYIAFIQDNDENPYFGESSFENITLYDIPSPKFVQLVCESHETLENSCYLFLVVVHLSHHNRLFSILFTECILEKNL